MFDDFSKFLKGSSGNNIISGMQPMKIVADTMRKLITKSANEGRISAKGRRGFRTKKLPQFAAYLDSLKNWGKYRVTQTKYPSHYTFRECRAADMDNRVKAQEKRDRKNQIRLANFANYSKV